MRETSVTTVKAPLDQVWNVLADHEGMSTWAPGLKAKLSKAGTTERNGVGAVRKIGLVFPGPIVEEVIDFEPGKRFGYKALAGVPLKNYRGEVVLREVPAGTEISYSVIADKRLPFGESVVAKAISRGLLFGLVRGVKGAA